jgi:hypothetical protein
MKYGATKWCFVPVEVYISTAIGGREKPRMQAYAPHPEG